MTNVTADAPNRQPPLNPDTSADQTEHIRAALCCTKQGCGCLGGWGENVHCPAHDDLNPSLSVSAKGTKVLVHCHAGCSQDQVLDALRERGLWPPGATKIKQNGASTPPPRKRITVSPDSGSKDTENVLSADATTAERITVSPGSGPKDTENILSADAKEDGCTLAQYAAFKQLPVEELVGFGLHDKKVSRKPAVNMPYLDVDGETVLAVKRRVSLTGKPKTTFRSGDKQHLYGRWHRETQVAAGYVAVVEGESDCHTLWHHGEPAVGLPGAGAYKDDRDGPYFDGIGAIYAVIEPDGGGENVLRDLAASRIKGRVKVIDLAPFGVKDVSALHLLDPEQFCERWAQAKAAAVPLGEIEREAQAEAAAEAAKEAGDLLDAPDVLDRVAKAVKTLGHAGDPTPVLFIYVTLTTRLTDRPSNVAEVSPSSVGKSWTVDMARRFMPDEAYVYVKAGSSRALIYKDESYEHRFVIFAEADSIPEDGPAASAIRSLASDNEMEYEVVERNEQTGRHTTRKISKPGPTGLLTTSTKSLGDQLGTRVLETAVSDSPDLTRQILQQQAREAAGLNGDPVDLAPFIAFQRWLALKGEHRVVVPFAEALADAVPVMAVRVRRDFMKLLSYIRTVAILHQHHRERDSGGRIIATLADYGAARTLLSSIFDTIAAEGVTPAIRETVEAVQEGETVTVAELAKRLNRATKTMHWRVRQARAKDYLFAVQGSAGTELLVKRGMALPEDGTGLPTVDAVRAAMEAKR